MLFNKQGQQVTVPAHFNSVSHPHIFAKLKEEHRPLPPKQSNMFKLSERAIFKQ